MFLVSIGIIKVGYRIKSFARSIDQSSLHPIRRLRLLIRSRDAYSRSPICLIVLSHQPPNTAEKVDSVVCQDPPVRLLPGTRPSGWSYCSPAGGALQGRNRAACPIVVLGVRSAIQAWHPRLQTAGTSWANLFTGRFVSEVSIPVPCHPSRRERHGRDRNHVGDRVWCNPEIDRPRRGFPPYLTLYKTCNPEDHGSRTGYMMRFNALSWYHNTLLRRKHHQSFQMRWVFSSSSVLHRSDHMITMVHTTNRI